MPIVELAILAALERRTAKAKRLQVVSEDGTDDMRRYMRGVRDVISRGEFTV